jgi:signal transduction histidine kinase
MPTPAPPAQGVKLPSTSPGPLSALRRELGGNKLFRGIAEGVLEELVEVPELIHTGADEVLFDEGENPDYLYLIVSGAVRVSKQGRGGRQETLSYFGDGDFFGEMALLDMEPRSARAFTTQPTILGRVDREGFERLLRAAPGRLSTNLARGIVERLRSANDQFIEELTRSERLNLIGSMATAVAHDFRNPMSAILMAAELIAETSDDEDHRESAGVIRRAVGQMVAMTDELLDYARGMPDLRRRRVPAAELMEQLDDLLLHRLERDGFAVERRVSVEGDLFVEPLRFSRVLVNVLKNAAEAMPDGGAITLSVEPRGSEVCFSVADTGVGIPPEVLPTVFEPFVTHGKSNGTGLGMAIARSVVEAHGGRIRVRSTPGVGTTVEITIPGAAGRDPVEPR